MGIILELIYVNVSRRRIRGSLAVVLKRYIDFPRWNFAPSSRRGFFARPRPSAARLLPACAALVHKAPMLIQPLPDPAAEREREQARRHPDQDTLELAAAGAAWTLRLDHSATKALTKASITMAKVDLWHARLALRTLRLDQCQAIAEAAED